MPMRVEQPDGDVADRIAILRLKVDRIADPGRQSLASAELADLEATWKESGHPPLSTLQEFEDLLDVNGQLWDVEDELRALIAAGETGPAFVAAALRVPELNHERARHKRSLSVRLGSRFVEVKAYGEARARGSG